MNSDSDLQIPVEQKESLHIGTAILVGQLIVNLPVILIILGILLAGIILLLILDARLPSISSWLFPFGLLALIFIGPSAGWLWWSFSVPRWRKWALQKGAPEDKLQKWAVITGLVWPKGSIFEKTEFRVRD